MSEYLIQDSTLTDIADAIRAKTGGSSAMTPDEMVTAIGSISGGGGTDDWEDHSGGNIMALIGHGTEYIDTGYLGNLVCLISAKIADGSQKNYEGYFAMSKDDRSMMVQRNAGTGIDAKCNTVSNLVSGIQGYLDGNPHEITISSANYNGYNVIATTPLYLLAGHYKGSLDVISNSTFYGLNVLDIFSLRFLKRYVPWLENGVPCVKELVDGTLHYNAGTGSFGYIDLNGVVHDA